ncbi:hypothetical protein NEPAR04_2446 [Nematocida parisii]|nr:hypothetical protein NEPAR03_0500 [Nematocida parisii]KAI5128252.1 hypothetical protein NEPAR08_1116 [Nematocida parisii]KAI5145434.1 hypothetical protein NEPAR04_2446 [Nematocida parisii]
MASHIDVNTLRTKLQNELKGKKGKIDEEDNNKLYNIIAEINREEVIFTELPEPLANLAYNILYRQVIQRAMAKDFVYTEDNIISKFTESLYTI